MLDISVYSRVRMTAVGWETGLGFEGDCGEVPGAGEELVGVVFVR